MSMTVPPMKSFFLLILLAILLLALEFFRVMLLETLVFYFAGWPVKLSVACFSVCRPSHRVASDWWFCSAVRRIWCSFFGFYKVPVILYLFTAHETDAAVRLQGRLPPHDGGGHDHEVRLIICRHAPVNEATPCRHVPLLSVAGFSLKWQLQF